MSKCLAIVMFILLGALTVACLPFDTQSAVTKPEPAAEPAVEPQAKTPSISFNPTTGAVAQADTQLPILPVAQGEEVPLLNEELQVTHGPLSGEVTDTAVTLWARGNVSGTLQFALVPAAEISVTQTISDNFANPIVLAMVDTAAEADFTGEVRVEGLEPASGYVYQVTLTDGESISTAVYGEFATAPAKDTAAPVNFVFGGCLGGQGFCRTEEGWIIFDKMAAVEPDFFVMVGDGVYMDTACAAEGSIPGAEGPFNELTGFRIRYRYHLEDPIYANFLAQTPIFPTWDDHEIINDAGGPALNDINPHLFADSIAAFYEYWPLQPESTIYRQFSYGAQADFFVLDTRSYRDPNVNWDPSPVDITPKTMLGEEQFAWLQDGLSGSSATWKFIISSVPLSYPTGFPQPQVDGRDGWANFTEKSGYETELLSLIFYIESQGIDNVIFITGDTHWPFAISYDPDRNGEADFYELSSSPLSAIPLAPAPAVDPTLNPTVMYAEGEFLGDLFNFGNIAIDEEGLLTFRIYDREGEKHYELALEPQFPEVSEESE